MDEVKEPVTPEVKPVVETPEQKPADIVAEVAEDKSLLGKEDVTQEGKESKDPKPVTLPEKYEVKAPEGMTVDQKLLEGLTPVFKKHNLTQEAVQELADAYVPMVKAQEDAQRQSSLNSFKDLVEGWRSETLTKLGADSDKELASAAKFINQMSETKEEATQLREFLDETGAGNFWLLVKLFNRAGKKISSDSFVEPNKQSTGGNASFYDHPTSKETMK